jgi:photosystem II stability/assembly factor-like uncharacterized protein
MGKKMSKNADMTPASRTTLVTLFSLIAVLTLLGAEAHAFGTDVNLWTSIGPDGGMVTSLAIDPQNPKTIYAGTAGYNGDTGGGIFRSTDGGDNWKGLSVPNSIGEPLALAIDPLNHGTVYAGTTTGVFKTTDGGASWSLQISMFVLQLAIDPGSPDTVFAVGPQLFKTTDGGTTWNAVLDNVSTVAIDPQNPRTVYARSKSGLFKSTDGGNNWSLTENSLAVYALAIDPQDSNTLYALGQSGGLFKSIDGGTSWSASDSGLPENSIISLAIDPRNEGTVYAVGSGVFKTTNGGKNWSPANSGLTSTNFRSLAIDPQNPATIYVVRDVYGLGGGVFKSTNGGMNWSEANSGLAATSPHALSIDPEDPDNIYGIVLGSVVKRAIGGRSWTPLLAKDVYTVAINQRDSRILYAVGNGGAYKSTDTGANWNGVDLQRVPWFLSAVTIDSQNTDTVYVGTWNWFQGSGVLKTTDAGMSWSLSRSGLPIADAIISFVIDPQRSSTVYAVLYDEFDDGFGDVHAGVYKSTDGGANWNAVNDGLPPKHYGSIPLSALTIDPKDPATLYAGTYNGVFKSTKGGASWTATNSGLTQNITSLAIDPLNPSTLYAGTSYSGVFKSADAGSTWSAVNPGLTALSVRSLAIDPKDPHRLYAATDGGGAFIITFSDSAVTEFRFDRTSVLSGGSFSASVFGPNLTTQTFFDVRYTSPDSNVSMTVLNWQRGVTQTHDVPAGTALGTWTISGVRAHEIETDHTGSFFPVFAPIIVSP